VVETEPRPLKSSPAPEDPFSPSALAEISAHPKLWAAIDRAAEGTLTFFDDCHPDFRWIFHDRGRYMTGLAAIALLGMGQLTLPTLRAICAAMDVSSPGRVNRFWTGMRASGHLTMTRLPDGGLDRRLAASPAYVEHFRRHRRAIIEAAGVIWPRTASAGLEAIADDARYLTVEAAICGVQAAHREAFQTRRDAPIFIFIERSGGLLILLHLFRQPGVIDGGAVELSIHGLAKQFHVSRAHVRKLMQDARDRGLLRLDEAARTVAFTPLAVEAYAVTSAMLLQAIRVGLETALQGPAAAPPL